MLGHAPRTRAQIHTTHIVRCPPRLDYRRFLVGAKASPTICPFTSNHTKVSKRHKHANRLQVLGTRKIYQGLSRRQASLLCQVRTGHCALNTYLAWRRVPGKVAICEQCRVPETRVHLLSCKTWRSLHQARRALVGQRASTSTATLLNTKEGVKGVLPLLQARLR